MTLADPFSRPRPGDLARYDRAVLLGGLISIAALCWWYLFLMVGDMSDMSSEMMPGRQNAQALSQDPGWTSADTLMIFFMWEIMMIGMMLPTALRSIMFYARINAQSVKRGKVFVSGYWFAAGYMLIWTLFSVIATILQGLLSQADLLSSMMVSSSYLFSSALLILSGMWQLSPIKNSCLAHCQSPVDFLASNYRPGISNAIWLGIKHGAFCLGCCWLIMCLLFVGGVMNLLWVAGITAFILAEKLLPVRNSHVYLSGWAMIASGMLYLTWNFY